VPPREATRSMPCSLPLGVGGPPRQYQTAIIFLVTPPLFKSRLRDWLLSIAVVPRWKTKLVVTQAGIRSAWSRNGARLEGARAQNSDLDSDECQIGQEKVIC
jgi:hypothetical protein